MTDFPDVLGMELHDASALLDAEGLPFIIIETKPAKKELTEGALRVIRVQPRVTAAEPGINPDSGASGPNRSLILTVCRI